jgi:hypothetical protein
MKQEALKQQQTGVENFLRLLDELETHGGFLPVVSDPTSAFCFLSLESFKNAWDSWMHAEIISRTNKMV